MTEEETKKVKIGKPSGFRDFFPEEYAKVDFVLGTMRRISREFGYVEYQTPAVELRKLYELKSGDEIVGETFKITSRSGQKLVLIPELTPTLTRMLAERQQYYTKPIRWFCIPRCYRDETLQRGRVKEFWQYNIDILGMDDIYADAEIITILTKIIAECGLSKKQFVVYINDRSFMQQFMESIGVTDFLSVFRVFDRKSKLFQESIFKKLKNKFPNDQANDLALKIRQNINSLNTIYEIIPQIKDVEDVVDNISILIESSFKDALKELKLSKDQLDILFNLSEIRAIPSNFLKQVKKLTKLENINEILKNLEELASLLKNFGITDYVLYDGSLARGLDYYTGIVFEAWSREGVLPRAIAGGGRYADLVAILGGQPLTGTGFGFGETVLMELMDEFKVKYPEQEICDVYIAPIKLEDLSVITKLSDQLRVEGLKTIFNPFDWKLKRHFENAEKSNVEWMIIVGNKDLANDAVTLRNIISGDQEIVPLKKIVSTLVKRVKK
ncbi:MAG: histidine--tRNA ligase family protein [Candidatus Heimdallarchaeota archaeon]|nr:histidine--tRNA ligase family protein [Candidatus Heimdallarchaeota archaeon]MCK4290081.1 histidine--tRNA ligase family protein [Candidatus Heimdallarchaeota archaeon]